MKHTSVWPAWLGYSYLILPVLIFLIGFCNLPTALIGTAVVTVSGYFLFKNAPKLWKPSTKQERILLTLTALVCLGWVYSAGVGAHMFQNPDHGARNAIFELLVTQPWPVLVNDGAAMLSYYIGFWLPSAVVGKLFHSVTLGYNFQILWGALGTFLTFYYLFAALGKKKMWVLPVFIFFSGLDIVGSILFINVHPFHPFNWLSHIEWWLPGLQFSSFTTQLYWVFNQAVPAWVLTLLLYHEKNNKGLVFLYSVSFICSTLPCMGLLPFLAWWCLQNGEKNLKIVFTPAHFWKSFKNALTFANLAGAGLVVLVSYTYLSGNIAGSYTSVTAAASQENLIWIATILRGIFPFFMLEAGLYLLCVARLQYKSPLFYICSACLLIYPFIRVGYAPDFCMRATIPAVLFLCLFVLQSLQQEKIRLVRIILVMFLLIGAITPVHEIARTLVYTSKGYIKQRPSLGGANFFSYTQNNAFLKYFGKHPH